MSKKIRDRLRILDEGYYADWVAVSRMRDRMWIPVSVHPQKVIPVDKVHHAKGEGARHFLDAARRKMNTEWQLGLNEATFRYWDAIQKPNVRT